MNESVETFILFFNNKGVHCVTFVSSIDTSIHPTSKILLSKTPTKH